MSERNNENRSEGARVEPTSGEPDVLLDIPNVTVGRVEVEVEDLEASVSLDARLGRFLKLQAGVDTHIRDVNLEIEGVRAEAHLNVYLDHVRTIIARAMDSVDENTETFEPVMRQSTRSTPEKAVDRVKKILPGQG